MIRFAAFVSLCLPNAPGVAAPCFVHCRDWQRKRDFPASYMPQIASFAAD